MSVWDDIEQTLSQITYSDADVLGAEGITYKSNARGVITTIPLTVIVRRFPPQNLPGGGVAAAYLEIDVPNASPNGVTTINKNGDTVLVADKQGGVPTSHPVNEIVRQDAGMWTLRLR